MEDGAAGYAVAWKNGYLGRTSKHIWATTRWHIECAALALELESASRRNIIPDGIG